MIWFIADPGRLRREYSAIDALTQEGWLQNVNWTFEAGPTVVVFATIEVGDSNREVKLTYPAPFPFAPPSVRPKVKEQWSSHQYGNGGELCLEYGPDNWVPEIAGADMLRSTYRLLSSEQCAVLNPDAQVPSRHELTVGQSLRFEVFRFAPTQLFVDELHRISVAVPATFSLRVADGNWVLFPASIGVGDDQWTDTEIPTAEMMEARTLEGFATSVAASDKLNLSSGADLRRYLLGDGCSELSDGRPEVLCVLHGSTPRAFYVSATLDSALEFKFLPLRKESPRLNQAYHQLSHKSVAIVGCGSLGSKVAVSLARSGVRSFVLLDDDILEPSNLVRNELDWTDVGSSKALALKRRILRIRPDASIETKINRLGGQESSSGNASALEAIGGCDVILDATASSVVFNVLASVSIRMRRAIIWAQIYAGGIGGLIARSRPGVDPDPYLARARLEGWYAKHSAPVPGVVEGDYSLSEEGRVLIADDAEVAIVAGHATRFVLASLLPLQQDPFPVSAYVVGMTEKWIFDGPFDTWPVDLGVPIENSTHVDPAEVVAGTSLIVQMIGNMNAKTAD